jgi:hypothetical protein
VVPLLEPGELGETVLPEELGGSQSFIADLASAALLLLPSALDALPLFVLPVPRLLLLDAEPLGPQSGFAIAPVVPDVEPAPDFELLPVSLPAAPGEVVVCAMAAPPKVSARTEAAVRR